MDPSLPLPDLIKACTYEPLASSCNYDFWSDKAFREGIPREYFDLVKARNTLLDGINTISPAYRYLQVVSLKQLPKETLAIYDAGKLIGMFESYYGLWLAVYRNDKELIEFFYHNLNISGGDIFWLLHNLTDVPPPDYGIHILNKILAKLIPQKKEIIPSANMSRDELLPLVEKGDGRAFILLADQGVDYPLLYNSVLSGNLTFVTSIPRIPLTEKEKKDIVLAGAQSGNDKILDLMEEYTGVNLSHLKIPYSVLQGIRKSLLYTGDMVSIYNIVSKLPIASLLGLTEGCFGFTSDLALLILERSNDSRIYYNLLYYNLGNLDLLLTLLPLRDNYEPLCFDLSQQEIYFPLGWNNSTIINCKEEKIL